MLKRAAAVLSVLACGAAAPTASASTLLRLDGIGPLRLGMTRTAAVGTGWLGDRGTGCPLGGRPYPITYRFSGRRAPAGLSGSAEFSHGRLTDLAFTRGVRTATGVRVGQTTAARMVSRSRSVGLSASSQFVSTFGGTFVTVKRSGREVLGAFTEHSVISTLAIPAVPVCE